MTEQRLTDAETAELDSYGAITGRTPLPQRAIELWERELLWGKSNHTPSALEQMVANLLDSTKPPEK